MWCLWKALPSLFVPLLSNYRVQFSCSAEQVQTSSFGFLSQKEKETQVQSLWQLLEQPRPVVTPAHCSHLTSLLLTLELWPKPGALSACQKSWEISTLFPRSLSQERSCSLLGWSQEMPRVAAAALTAPPASATPGQGLWLPCASGGMAVAGHGTSWGNHNGGCVPACWGAAVPNVRCNSHLESQNGIKTHQEGGRELL